MTDVPETNQASIRTGIEKHNCHIFLSKKEKEKGKIADKLDPTVEFCFDVVKTNECYNDSQLLELLYRILLSEPNTLVT